MKRKETNVVSDKIPDYSLITEVSGLKASQEQLRRLYQRYELARKLAEGKDILEIGCGSGIGLGYLARFARKVVGGDIEEKNVSLAKEYYKDRTNIIIDLIDAHNLPFPDGNFDLALVFETIYYLIDPQKGLSEIRRVLRENGILVICTVNKDWEDFHPSPYTYKYFSAPELYELMKKNFQEVKLYGGFPTNTGGKKSEIISVVKRLAVKFHLIPGSLEARAYLKRIFMGKLVPLPSEITEDMIDYEPPIEIPIDKVTKDFKILYAIGKK